MGHLEHKKSAPVNLNFAVITVTDTRSESEDKGRRNTGRNYFRGRAHRRRSIFCER